MPSTQGAVEHAKTCPDAKVKVTQLFAHIMNTIIMVIISDMLIMVTKCAMTTLVLRLRLRTATGSDQMSPTYTLGFQILNLNQRIHRQ